MIPVIVSWASKFTCGLGADALAVFVIPPLTVFALLGVAVAVAFAFAPVETVRALLWFASASALFIVKDLIVTANLGSASAGSDGDVVEISVICAFTNNWLA